jgi:uncharacterized membrane-anchored protein YhcB (DUF1043 family)
MTDYARVAEVLKEMASELDELYHHLSVPRRKQALTAAAALCEARAAPIDAAKERTCWKRSTHHD